MSVGEFWDHEVAAPTHTSWMEHPRVRDYVLRSISPEGCWPVDWFVRRMGTRRFRRGLSISSGEGSLRRDVLATNLVDRIDEFDGSTSSLLTARGRYDVVFIQQTLHRVTGLEKLLRGVLHALEADGVLYLDEYVGPSRLEWTDELIAPQRAVFDEIPTRSRRTSFLRYPKQDDDPSEAVRSSEILEQLAIGFDVVAKRGYGGNLLAVLYPNIRASDELIEDLIAKEKAMLAAGAAPYYVVAVAEPKRGMAKRIASARLFTEPKLKRIGREIRARFGR